MKRTILIADSDAGERAALSAALKEQIDRYDIVEAENGDIAAAAVTKTPDAFSAVVINIRMCGDSFFETLEAIKGCGSKTRIPVIVITGNDGDDGFREKAIDLGADSFVTTPVSPAVLRLAVRNAIRLRESAEIADTFMRDKLTGLLNRESFFAEAERMIKNHPDGSYILSCIDVENFKFINDQYGTDGGDGVLRHMADCLNKLVADHNGLTCRYMADKFAVLYPAEIVNSDGMLANHREIVFPPCINKTIRIRVGRYPVTDKNVPISKMFDCAAMAEYSVKNKYDKYIVQYNEAMRDRMILEQSIINCMEDALKNGEFEPWYQPQYNHATGAMIGAEALVRWKRDGRYIAPYEFVPVFERNGFIYEMDQYMWERVCVFLRRKLDEGKTPLPVSINISRRDLFHKHFIQVLTGIIGKYDIPNDLIRLEVTESAFADASIVDKVDKLIELGFTVEIDDFGSGYSSLNTIKDVPASILKLDMKFFENTKNSQRGGNIVESVVRMAKWLGMAVIAEGVEEKEQADYLKSIGCYYIQGYYYSKPVPEAEYEKLCEETAGEPKLTRLRTLETLDNNEFWNPKSMETLIFNSYVGGACIFEVRNGEPELLRTNEQYARELGGLIPTDAKLYESDFLRFVKNDEMEKIRQTVERAASDDKEASCEVRLADGGHAEYIRITLRLIARAAERLLFYSVIVNMTEQRQAERKQAESARQLDIIMKNAGGGVSAAVMKDGRVKYLFTNDSFYTMLGYTREQFAVECPDGLTGRLYPEDKKEAIARYKAYAEGSGPATFEFRAVRRDGSIIWLHANGTLCRFGEDGEMTNLAVYTDITKMKEAEREKDEAARRLSAIMSNVNGSVSAFLMDDEGNSTLIFGNDNYYGIFGYTKAEAEAQGLDTMTCIVPDDFDGVVSAFNKLKRDGKPVVIDYRAQKRDGSIIYVRSNSSLMSMDGYGDKVIVAVETDITERMALENQLKAVVANISGGVSASYLHEGRLKFVIVNDRFFELTGLTREELDTDKAKNFDFVHPHDRLRVRGVFEKASETEEPYTVEYRILRDNGAVRHILCNTSIIRFPGIDEPVQLSVSNDITQLREAQKNEHALALQMQTVMDNISGGIAAVIYRGKDDMSIDFSNDGFYSLYGYTKEQMNSELTSLFELVLPEDREEAELSLARIVESGGSGTSEHRCCKRDGSIIRTQVTSTVIKSGDTLTDNGDETVLLTVVTDCTELRRAESEKAAATDKLRAVMNSMQNGITAVIYRGDGIEVLFANDRYYEIHGTEHGSLTKFITIDDAFSLVCDEDREYVRKTARSALSSGKSVKFEYRINIAGGKRRYLKCAINNINISGVDMPVQVATFTDITSEKETAEQLRFLNDSAHDILAQPDCEKAINNTLRNMMEYFGGDRSYVIESNPEKDVTNNTYEICDEGVESEMQYLQNVPAAVSKLWFDKLEKNEYIVIPDVNAIGDNEAELREMLLHQSIRSIIITPLWRDGVLVGFTGIDNPTQAVDQLARLRALGDYIAVLLTRRDLLVRIKRDSDYTRQLLDDTPGGFACFEITENGTVLTYYNEVLRSMLGTTDEEIKAGLGRDAYSCVQSEDVPKLKKTAHAALASSGRFTEECRLRHSGEGAVWVSVSGRFTYNADGKRMLNVYFTDITEQKNAEAYQTELLDNLPSGAALYRFDGRKISAVHINKSYWKLVKREASAAADISVLDAVHPDDVLTVFQEIKSAIRQKRNVDITARLRYGEAGYRPFAVTATVIPVRKGMYLLCASYVPVSDENMSVHEMIPVALSAMMTASEYLAYVKDKDQRYMCCSDTTAKALGLESTRDIIGKTDYDLFDKSIARNFTARGRSVIETGKSITGIRERVPMKDGFRLMHTSVYPILDAAGTVIGEYGVSRDITDVEENEFRLRVLTESVPGGIASYYIGKSGISLIRFNDGYYAFSGYTREEYAALAQKDPLCLIIEEDKPKVHEFAGRFIRNPESDSSGSCVYRCRTKNGAIRWMSLRAVVSGTADGGILNVVQVDITEQKLADEKKNELLDRLPCGAALYRYDGDRMLTAVHVNKRYTELVGRSSTENASQLESVHPEDMERLLGELGDAIADKRDAGFDIRLRCGDGEYRPFRLDASILPCEGGEYLMYVTFNRLSDSEISFRNVLPFIFSTIMNSSSDIAYAKDSGLRYLCCSKTFAGLVGIDDPADIVGRTDADIFPAEIAEKLRRSDSMLISSGETQTDITEVLPSHDGETHYISLSKHILKDTAGNTVGIYSVGRDITGEREAFAQLKLFTESVPGGLATFKCTPEKITTLYLNEGLRALSGYSKDEYGEKQINPLSFTFDEDKPMIKARVRALLTEGTPLDCTFRIHKKDGGYVWLNCKANEAEHYGDTVIVNSILTDVTEQQEEKEQLRVAEEEYRLATRHSSLTICRYNIETSTLTMSPDTAERLELPEVLNNVPESRLKLGIISTDTEEAYAGFYRSIRSGALDSKAIFMKQLKGSWRWISAHATDIFDNGGKPVAAIISYADITEEQEKEAVYKKWQNSLKDRKKDSYTLFRCNLSRNASFDSCEGNLLNIKFDINKQTFNERTNEFTEQCVYAEDRESYRAFMNSDTMLAEYYRGHRSDSKDFREVNASGEVRWLRVSVDLVEYPNSKEIEAYLMYEDIDESKRAELMNIERAETDPLTGLLNRAAFADKVNRCLNAAAPGTVNALLMMDIDGFKMVNDVFGHGAGDQALVDIAEMLSKISRKDDLACRLGGDEFLMFFPDIPGEQIAAKKAEQICELTRKTFSLEVHISGSIGIAMWPKDGEGFESLYKVADEALYKVKNSGKNGYAFRSDTPAVLPEAELPAPAENGGRGRTPKKRILIVDDNKADHLILGKLFGSDYIVENAMNGEDALTMLRHFGSAVSVVLLDLMMPGIDGYGVLKRMQQNAATSMIPVIVVSGDDSRETALSVINAGAADFVTKPIDPDILRIRVKSAISKAENEKLRAQNSFLSMQNSEVESYKTALEQSGILVIIYDWAANTFTYSRSVRKQLAGRYDERSLWHILRTDMVADSQSIEKLQRLTRDITDDRGRSSGSMTVRLKTINGKRRMYDVCICKEINEYGLSSRLIITLREAEKNRT